MKNKRKKWSKEIRSEIAIGIVLLVAIAIGAFVLVSQKNKQENEVVNIEYQKPIATQEQQKIQPQEDQASLNSVEELKEVSFCGRKYLTKRFVVDGVDVIQRIANIFKNEKYKKRCLNYQINTKDGDVLDVNSRNGDENIYFYIFFDGYKIDKDLKIYIFEGYTGNPTFIGKLK